MSVYRVYATRWDAPGVVDEIPASSLEFTLPLSDHGECSFSATVEPGRSQWRPSIAPVVSGVLVCRDDVPVWSGFVWSERQSGPRTFDFQCAEWGSFFERVPAPARVDSQANDHAIFRDLISDAQAIPGQNVNVQLGSTLGAAWSDYSIKASDDNTVEAAFRQLGDAADGPEWYFQAGGTLEAPKRILVLADRAGRTTPQFTLEYVEDTEAYTAPEGPPTLTLLGNLFPSQEPQALVGGRRGGNVIAHPARNRDGTNSATAAVAIGAGEEAAQLRAPAVSPLIGRGYPRITQTRQYPDVTRQSTLQRHADADLAAAQGLVTSYTLTTYDGDPEWTEIQRGDPGLVILDTDVYGAQRPVEFQARLLNLAVSIDDDVTRLNWTLATVLEA